MLIECAKLTFYKMENILNSKLSFAWMRIKATTTIIIVVLIPIVTTRVRYVEQVLCDLGSKQAS